MWKGFLENKDPGQIQNEVHHSTKCLRQTKDERHPFVAGQNKERKKMGPFNFWSSGMWIFPLIMITIFLVIFGIFGRGGFRPPWSRGDDRHRNENPDSETPLDILKKRYAKGEINKEEFDQMKTDL